MLQEARRAMQAAEFDEGVAVIDIQLARILIERGQFAAAEAAMSHTAAEFTRLQKHAFALEASVVLAEARLSQANAAAALDLLDRAAQAAGSGREPDPPTHRACARARAGRCSADRGRRKRNRQRHRSRRANTRCATTKRCCWRCAPRSRRMDARDEDRARSRRRCSKASACMRTPRPEENPMVAAGS